MVFVADVSEIDKCVEALASMGSCITRPLHGNSSAADKRRALEPAARAISTIIIAANVAETSITINGVKFVINYGVEKILLGSIRNWLRKRLSLSAKAALAESQTVSAS